MADSSKLQWDGEKIVEKVVIEDRKFTPKELLDSLDHVRNQIQQMEGQKIQLESNLRQMEKNIESAKKFESERKEFEAECERIQLEKLEKAILSIKGDCEKIALNNAEKIIEKDPSAYTEDQKKNLKYVEYQKLIATNEKIANKISRRMIIQHLYDKPIFTNPF